MYEFKSDSRYEVGGRGQAFSVLNPVTCYNFSHLLYQQVVIDGVQYEVAGVESYAHAWPICKDEHIGLLVKNCRGGG